MIDTLVVLAALGWVVWVWLTVAWQLRRGAPISPPLFASANLFALGIALLIGIGASPLHLLWWFPLSVLLGALLLALLVWVQFNMGLFERAGRVGPSPRSTKRAKPSTRTGRGPETAVPCAPAE